MNCLKERSYRAASLMLTLVAAAACSENPGGSPASASPNGTGLILSGASMYPQGCGDVLPEPGSGLTSDIAMAINPVTGRDIAVAWMQDARADTTAHTIAAAISRDGGSSFETFALPGVTACTGGSYAVVRDPDLAHGADGTLYFGAIVGGATSQEPGALIISRSSDGGREWAPFTTLETGAPLPEVLYAVDRPELAGDRTRPGHAYVAYMRLLPNFPANNAIVLSRTLDGGETWSVPAVISQIPGAGNIVGSLLSLEDGALLHIYRLLPANAVAAAVIAQITGAPLPLSNQLPPSAIIVASRSTDLGETWSIPVYIGAHEFPGYAVTDPDTGLLIDYLVLRAAVSPDGAIYAAWQNQPDSDGLHTVSMVRSMDGGASWGEPSSIVSEPHPTIQPSLAVSANGRLALTFYDQRMDPPGGDTSLANLWIRTSADGGSTWSETSLAGPFDMRSTILTDGSSMNLGNPQALLPLNSGFAAAHAVGRPVATQAPMAILFQAIE